MTESRAVISLTLDPYMAMMLDLLVCAASELAQGNVESSVVMLKSVDRLASDHPDARDRLVTVMSHISDSIPADIVKQEGMHVATLHEIRARVGR